MSNSPITAVRLPPKQHEALRTAAAQTNTSVSAIVRDALPAWVRDGLQPGDRVTIETSPVNGARYYRVHTAKPAAKPAPAPATRAHRAPARTTYAEDLSQRRAAAKAADDALRAVGADGLSGHERAEAAKLKDPKQREKFAALARQSRQRRITNRTGK